MQGIKVLVGVFAVLLGGNGVVGADAVPGRCSSLSHRPVRLLITGLSLTVDSAFLGHCSNHTVTVRLPPTINPDPKMFSSWVAPPPGWFYGNWKVTYTSQPVYLPLQNMQYDGSPVFPQSSTLPGQNNDLTSYQLANDSTVFTAYGIDTPRRSNDPSLGAEWEAVYDFVGTGSLAATNNTWELLAWGYDTRGDGYMAIYETPVAESGQPSGLDILSRSENGPGAGTLKGIYDALLTLGNTELSGLVHSTQKLVIDGQRTGMPPVQCDVGCVNNINVVS